MDNIRSQESVFWFKKSVKRSTKKDFYLKSSISFSTIVILSANDWIRSYQSFFFRLFKSTIAWWNIHHQSIFILLFFFQMFELKFELLRCISEHEHFVPLNFPFDIRKKGDVHESTLNDYYCKRHFLVGVLLREVSNTLFSRIHLPAKKGQDCGVVDSLGKLTLKSIHHIHYFTFPM